MKFSISIAVLICSIIPGFSQSQRFQKMSEKLDEWHYGFIYYNDGSKVKEELSFNVFIPPGMVKVKSDTGLKILTVNDIQGFEYYDSTQSKHVKYLSLPIRIKEIGMTNKYFVEMLYENRLICLLNHKTYLGQGDFGKPKVRYTYLLLKVESGEIDLCNRGVYFEMISPYQDKMKYYLSENKNKLRSVDDYAQAISYYEFLMKSQSNDSTSTQIKVE